MKNRKLKKTVNIKLEIRKKTVKIERRNQEMNKQRKAEI